MSTGLSDDEKHRRLATGDPAALIETCPPKVVRPFIVRPAVARKLLGNIGPAKLWELINSGELDSFLDGRSRFITMESIDRRIARKLADARDQTGRLKLYEHNPAPAPPPAADAGGAKARRKRGQTNSQQTPARPD
jgi:hypothetical protein